MIRFNCPSCSRFYELPDALAHLPLFCKGCGQSLAVPAPMPDPAPEPAKPVAIPVVPVSIPVARPAAPPVLPAPGLNGDYTPVRPKAERPPLHDNLEIAKPVSANASPAAATAPVEAPAVASPRARMLVPIVVDIGVGLVLLFAGVFLGEQLARQSTREVLSDASSAVKFPPLELILWLSPPVLFALVYSLLVSRGRSIGAWLARRAES